MGAAGDRAVGRGRPRPGRPGGAPSPPSSTAWSPRRPSASVVGRGRPGAGDGACRSPSPPSTPAATSDLVDEALARIPVHNPGVDQLQPQRPRHHPDRAVRLPDREPAVPRQPDPGAQPARRSSRCSACRCSPPRSARGPRRPLANERGPLRPVTVDADLEVRAGQVPFRTDPGPGRAAGRGAGLLQAARSRSPAELATLYRQLYASFLLEGDAGRRAGRAELEPYETVPLDGADPAGRRRWSARRPTARSGSPCWPGPGDRRRPGAGRCWPAGSSASAWSRWSPTSAAPCPRSGTRPASRPRPPRLPLPAACPRRPAARGPQPPGAALPRPGRPRRRQRAARSRASSRSPCPTTGRPQAVDQPRAARGRRRPTSRPALDDTRLADAGGDLAADPGPLGRAGPAAVGRGQRHHGHPAGPRRRRGPARPALASPTRSSGWPRPRCCPDRRG